MKRYSLILAAALALLSAPQVLPGQTLAHTAPPTALLYFRSYSDDPVAALNRFTSSNLFWSNPIDLQKDVFEAMDKGFEQADAMLGLNVGSLSRYFRSIKGIEGVVYNIELTDSFPDIEFALKMDTPMADEIYDLISGKLVEEAMGDLTSDGQFEFSGPDSFGMNIGKHRDSIIFASSASLFREITQRIGGASPGNLTQSEGFKEALESSKVPDYCMYVNTGRVLELFGDTLRNQGRRFAGRRAEMGMATIQSLGLWELAALGWMETDSTSRLSMLAKKPISAFSVLDAGKGGPEGLNAMPADVLGGLAWCGNGTRLWKQLSAFILDGEQFPFAAFAEEGIRNMQREIGLKAEEIGALAEGGGSIFYLPSPSTRMRMSEDNFVITMRPSPLTDTAEVVARVNEALMRRREGVLELSVEDGVQWYRFKRNEQAPGREKEMPAVAVFGGEVIAGLENLVKRVIDCRTGKAPTLATYAATQGLPPQASAYAYIGLKTVMGQNNRMAPAHALMRDGSGVAAAISVDGDRCVIQTNRSISSVIGTFTTAEGIYENQSRTRREIQRELEEVAKAYAAYRALHGTSPPSLETLGFKGDKALKYPGQTPASGGAPKPYALIAIGDVDLENARDIIVCTTADTRYGRLVGTLNGSSRSLSEAQFQAMLKNQRGGR